MASKMGADGSQETYFAQHLASNNPKIRNRAMKKLGLWLKSRSNSNVGLTEDDLLKIWKGLFYCMWMSDKPLVQESLADQISSLVHCFGQLDITLMFVDTFLQTMSREWFGIDRFRIEKFMMFIRRFFGQCFQFLAAQKWKPKIVNRMLEVMAKTALSADNDITPQGMKFHVYDIFVEELQKAGGHKLSSKQISLMLRPFAEILVSCRDKILCAAVVKSVFHTLIYDAVEYEDVETTQNEQKFQLNFAFMASRLMELSSREGIAEANRAKIYKLVGYFRDTAQGIFPFDRKNDSDSGTDLDDDDIDAAAKRLIETKTNDRKPKRVKRKSHRH